MKPTGLSPFVGFRGTDDDYAYLGVPTGTGRYWASYEHRATWRLFQGREYDLETGFYWYRTRYYDPRAGRFTSRDPIGIWGDPLNLGNGYTFVGNNPWTMMDPYGLAWYNSAWNTAGDIYNGIGVGLYGMWEGASGIAVEAWEKNENPLALALAPQWTRASQTYAAAQEVGGMGSVDASVLTGLEVVSDQLLFTNIVDVVEGETKEGMEIKGAEAKTAHLTPVIVAYGTPALCKVVGATGKVASGASKAMRKGKLYEAGRLRELGAEKNNGVWRPSQADIDSAAFKVVVGKPKYTPRGRLKGSIPDSTNGIALEIKGGSSPLSSSCQLRLQVYYSLKHGVSMTIDSTRPVNPTFRAWLERWGVEVRTPGG